MNSLRRASLGTLVTCLLACLAQAAHAEVTLHDTLDCAFADGSFVRLSRAVHASLTPVPIMHGSRVRKEGQWRVEYHQAIDGTRRPMGAWVQSSGDAPMWLAHACSYLGLQGGTVMAPWVSASATETLRLPLGNWNARVPDEASRRDVALRTALSDKGLAGGIWNLHFVRRAQGGELVSEQALVGSGRAGTDGPIAAVYQSRSMDDGKTWSEPVVTSDAEIFEIGKAWREQCFLAAPVRYNGRSVVWPARCADDTSRR